MTPKESQRDRNSSPMSWLYESRTDRFGTRIRRFGSRRYGVVANWMSGDRHLSSSLMATVWRLHFATGPYGGVEAGFDYAKVRGRIWLLRGGRGVGIGWGPR